ncbi:TonB-dependent receptor [Microbulbifer flavimaris]|uniref:TonB-dependent receptor n=1 Tax=Microbulbifer flavimaris TaxID=1781068 RepID=A0ABX4HXS8_9GAMM|nr:MULTISPECIES: TonB-dependent receptor [Microbulbifer]KUJ82510.1 TonB-dependent receptor [Microbulbifer sp. ZGT114]PCO04716.1 TonB-dependent receptor [Microbulbifer flavimaris]
MFQKNKLSSSVAGVGSLTRAAVVAAGTLFSAAVMAQQSGSIEGKVFLDAGVEAAGVTVKATSPVMPRGRTATTGEDGEFKLPALIPGTYTLEFSTEDGITRSVTARVLLDQKSNVSVVMVPEADANSLEEIEVTGQQIVVGGEASLSNALGSDVVDGVPIGTNYRDMMKLIPGVQYTENAVRGANAGGSGQDNTYAFDGVNITLPMFGTLSAEPSSHDIEMVTVDRGGSNAIGFNRSGGFSVDSKSKSGTNEFHAGFEHKMMPKDFVGENNDGVEYELNQSWTTMYASGPLIEDQLFFYGSYYGPRSDRDNKATAYGDVKDFTSERDEYFGKLTWAATDDILLNGSFRTSERIDEGASIGANEADSVSLGSKSTMEVITLDGSWVINDSTTFTAQLTSYAQEGADQPDRLLGVQPDLAAGLDTNNLADMGYLSVPVPTGDNPDFDAFVQPIINQYGYINDAGDVMGGGGVGAYSSIWEQNFYRKSFEMALDHNLEWGSTSHEIHVGFQWNEGEEELTALSNGWGSIRVLGGLETIDSLGVDPTTVVGDADPMSPVYYSASIQQMSLGIDGAPVSPINSFTENYNFEVNDKIDWNDFTFNVGFLISEDILYGEGLREANNFSGFVEDAGNKYEMYRVDWKDMIQPRLGVTYRYNDAEDTVFLNYGHYNPSVSSLARAASWARNSRRSLSVYFDENGDFLAYNPASGSSGKVFEKDMDPRLMEELTLGTTRNVMEGLNIRAHVRYRENDNYWEDTPYYTPSGWYFNQPERIPADVAAEEFYAYSADEMAKIREELPSTSSYVIAQIDGAYTKYWEASLEAEWVGDRTYLNASYVRSRYSGNFDQDNTSSYSNDASLFVGSSSLMDWETLNIWDNREGTLTGDRPHIFKAFGYYTTDWNANVGAYLLYQSGHAWQVMDGTVYGYEPAWWNDSGAYGEKAGSRRTPSHWQLDLNYTQNFQVFGDYTLKVRADLFNVFDRQTGYDPQQKLRGRFYDFGEYRRYYNSRRLQLSFGVDF